MSGDLLKGEKMKSKYLLIKLLASVALLASCGSGAKDTDVENVQQVPSAITTPSAGRLLASQCAQCHGTEGISISDIDSLAGESDEILEEMNEMQGENEKSVMHLQAKGYTQDQIIEIANYFSTLYPNGESSSGDEREDDEDKDKSERKSKNKKDKESDHDDDDDREEDHDENEHEDEDDD